MAVCIIFKSSAIRAQFKLHYSKPPNDIYVFAKKKKKKPQNALFPIIMHNRV